MSCSVEVLARGGGVYQSAKAIPKTNITMAGRYTSQCTPVTAISVPNRLSHEEPDECCAIIDKKRCGPWTLPIVLVRAALTQPTPIRIAVFDKLFTSRGLV